jgi:benzylsuccinate CoA-transferase BbsF subunit
MTLNMELPKAREIAWKLVKWCDVLAEGFTPGVMKRWDMDYESVRKVKPDIIYLSTCQQGQYGPHAGFRGYGGQSSSMAGFFHLTGWPDREPAFCPQAITDFITPRFNVIAIAAAIDYRRRTGKGQYIDSSQFEAGVTFLAPAVMDYFVNGRIGERNGNRMPDAAPHAAYACQGEDRWVAIAVTNDGQWQAFCRVIGKPQWTRDPKFQTLLARKENEDELNRLVEEWTKGHTAEEVMRVLQAAGVPAGVVQNYEDLFKDPQLKHRGYFVVLNHPVVGSHTYERVPYKLSKSPQGPRWPGPVFGQHVEKVCTEFLGMSKAEMAALSQEGVFQ